MIKIYLLLLIALWGCSNKETYPIPIQVQKLENYTVYSAEDKTTGEISFIKDAVYGDSDEILIGSLGEISADRTGRVYISDSKSLIIHVFEPEGTYSGSLGGDGRDQESLAQ